MSESNKLWGGRFEGKIDPGFAEFNNSYRFDRRLFEADVTASIAYCQALENARVITADEGTQIRDALVNPFNVAFDFVTLSLKAQLLSVSGVVEVWIS